VRHFRRCRRRRGARKQSERRAPRGGNSLRRPKGHERLAADEYPRAERIACEHPDLKVGDRCPMPNCRGKLYYLKQDTMWSSRRRLRSRRWPRVARCCAARAARRHLLQGLESHLLNPLYEVLLRGRHPGRQSTTAAGGPSPASPDQQAPPCIPGTLSALLFIGGSSSPVWGRLLGRSTLSPAKGRRYISIFNRLRDNSSPRPLATEECVESSWLQLTVLAHPAALRLPGISAPAPAPRSAMSYDALAAVHGQKCSRSSNGRRVAPRHDARTRPTHQAQRVSAAR
jgi:hypothetical protein